MQKKKKQRPLWKDLILIPIQLVLDEIWLFLGAYLDTKIVNPDAYGHPTFALTIVFSVIAAAASIIVLTYVLAKVIMAIFRKD
ncbi:MAG: hypothetical protein Q4D71_01485 [Oscillospiraceae bacterium]|nr:hypothetical protein [Oscillospiraceae bacterium]MBR0450621.1 hypothetical protein [Oscillospiraceae bacterium]MDO5137105.1 hypothetical protein [Oscillospiraceae bacterium]